MKRLLSFLLAAMFLICFAASGTSCTALLLTALISNRVTQDSYDTTEKVESSGNIWFDPYLPDTEEKPNEDAKDESEEPPVMYPDANGNGIPDFEEDANGNGILDFEEDENGNGIPDFDEDENGNGIPDSEDPTIDDNMNGIPDINEDPDADHNGNEAIGRPENGLLSGEEFVLDGNLDDFRKYSESALAIFGVEDNTYDDSQNKSAHFYGVITKKGMYVACEAYHNILAYGDANDPFSATSFLILVGDVQVFAVSATGENEFEMNDNGIEGHLKTEEWYGSTSYRSVAEIFIPAYDLEFYGIYTDSTESAEICLAWTTPGDMMSFEYNSADIVTWDIWEIPFVQITRYGIYSEDWGH